MTSRSNSSTLLNKRSFRAPLRRLRPASHHPARLRSAGLFVKSCAAGHRQGVSSLFPRLIDCYQSIDRGGKRSVSALMSFSSLNGFLSTGLVGSENCVGDHGDRFDGRMQVEVALASVSLENVRARVIPDVGPIGRTCPVERCCDELPGHCETRKPIHASSDRASPCHRWER